MAGDIKDLLIEIGTEELPPRLLGTLMYGLANNFSAALNKAQFVFERIKPFASPRRLGFIVSKLSFEQPAQRIERKGPSLAAAYDGTGALTKAALGFMASCGVDNIDQLEQLETGKGTWLVFNKEKPGATLNEKITALLVTSIAKLPIARKMRWGASRAEFVRPVHGLVALYGNAIVATNLFGLEASNQSRGHRFMANHPVTIASASSYIEQLHAAKVIVDFEARKSIITAQLKMLAKQENARVVIDSALLDEVTALVEWPVCLRGKFDKRFLDVPTEVLISAMQKHQRYFHLLDQQGKLLPRFITVSNIESTHPDTVITGNERVIAARLSDAAFFYSKDKQSTLASKLDRLPYMVFQAKLGSYSEKTQRISALAGYVADAMGANRATAESAGRLCKADLVSDMVNEFTDLQGLMGAYYARHDGETAAVCSAIADHYRPTGAGGNLPDSPAGCCLAIADKMDTITGLFGVGEPPTGSRDPFALRRKTLGIIRICIEKKLPVSLLGLLEKSASLYDRNFDSRPVLHYFLDRLANWYQDLGIAADTYNAIRKSTLLIDRLDFLDRRVQALAAFRSGPQAQGLIAANKRIANLLSQMQADIARYVDTTRFLHPAENNLFAAVKTASTAIDDLASSTDYKAQYPVLADLQSPLGAYFENVMVMAEDHRLKTNRLAMLGQLRRLFLSVADLSLLQQ